MLDMPQIGATLTNDMIEEIKKIAKIEKRSFSEMIALLVEEAFEKRKVEELVK